MAKKKMTKRLMAKTLQTMVKRFNDCDELDLTTDYALCLYTVLHKLSLSHPDIVMPVLDQVIEDWSNDDVWGTEGQNDPRGDQRND